MTMTIQQRQGEAAETTDHIVPVALGQSEQLAILEQLQVSIDLDQLIRLIHEQTGRHLPIDGLEYRHETLGLSVMSGQKAAHSCGYRLMGRDEHTGELVFRRHWKFRARDLAQLEALIPLFFAPLRNALHFRLAMDHSFRDPISGARNERSLWQVLPREISLSRRHNRPLSGILLDIEGLRRINHEFSAAAGDHVLKSVVTLADDLCRDTDMTFRVEDDTLLVLLQEATGDGAALLADRLLEACNRHHTIFRGQRIQAAIRLACVTASGTDSADSFINRGLDALQRRPFRGRCLDERRSG
ncbi:MAG: GGDEF domain-containing protein [Pseudomonadota bacterium]